MEFISKKNIFHVLLSFLFLISSIAVALCQQIDAINLDLVSSDYTKIKSDEIHYELKEENLEMLLRDKTSNIALNISVLGEKKAYELHSYDLLSDNFIITTDNNFYKSKSDLNTKFYIGKEKNNINDVISMSIINNELSINLRSNTETFILKTLKSSEKNQRLQLERISQTDFECSLQENRLIQNIIPDISNYNNTRKQLKSSASIAPVDIYVETTYQTYLDHGSTVGGVNTFVNNLFNAVASLYNTIPVTIQVSQINVYTSAASDPYYYIFSDGSLSAGQKSSLALDEMPCVLGVDYNGRLAHLIHSTTGNSSNGIAQVPSCPASNSYDSPLYGTSTVYDNSISSQYLLAHEIGHNLSSPHTHACFWNGNDTAIDGCAPTEGGCALPANMSGTIMSYCANGVTFHSQVKTQISDFVNQCLDVIDTSCPAVEELDLTINTLSTTSIEINYNPSNANFLFIYYREINTTTWSCHNGCSSSGTTVTLTGLTPGINYEIAPLVICTSGGQSPATFNCPIIINTNGNNPSNDPDCSHSGNIVISTNNPDQIIFTDGASIKTQTLQQVLIPQDNTHWRAIDYVEILPNFEVPLNQTFEISIGPCN